MERQGHGDAGVADHAPVCADKSDVGVIQAQVLTGPVADGMVSFAAIVPSTLFGEHSRIPRRVAILLDRSGSMQGEPIAQARKAIEACLAALSEEDSFVLLAFDDHVEAMSPSLVTASCEQRERARAFMKQADARGGTELAAGVYEAARQLGTGGDIVVITDGQVFGTEKILAQARSTGTRLYCLGIGTASQDRFLSLLARETGGISRFVTARERVDVAAVDLFASIGRPVASGLKASNVHPDAPHVVFAGTPVLLFGEMNMTAREPITLSWDGGSRTFDVPSGDAATGETVRLLWGSRLITDWESRYPSEEALASFEKRRQSRVAARLLELSRTFGLASREMSLVAVVKRIGDRPGELPETRVVPVGMPQDTAFTAYFGSVTHLGARQRLAAMPQFSRFGAEISASYYREPLRLLTRKPGTAIGTADLVDLAAMLEPDGGMPGDRPEVRAGRTIAALFAFVAEGHTPTTGAFRLHVSRLVRYLESLRVGSDREKQLIATVLEAIATGRVPASGWLRLAREVTTDWNQIEAALE